MYNVGHGPEGGQCDPDCYNGERGTNKCRRPHEYLSARGQYDHHQDAQCRMTQTHKVAPMEEQSYNLGDTARIP
jgi:hypothetical protein